MPAGVGAALLWSLAVYAVASGGDSPGTRDGRWHYLGGDSHHTRYSPADQINADNIDKLEEA
jgi:glucose dehydrogenase